MVLTCNIDAKGKRVRLLGGVATLMVAAVLAVLCWVNVLPGWVWFVAAGAAIGGAFQIFEARAGWCAVRAMGIKTPV